MQNRRLLSPGLLFATLLFLTSAAFADDFAYDFTGSNQWGTIDLNTGVFTQLGNTGTLLAGIGTLNGNYYGGQWGGSTLYQVNPANGGWRIPFLRRKWGK